MIGGSHDRKLFPVPEETPVIEIPHYLDLAKINNGHDITPRIEIYSFRLNRIYVEITMSDEEATREYKKIMLGDDNGE